MDSGSVSHEKLASAVSYCSRTSHSLVKERGVGDDQRRWHGRVVPALYLLHKTIALSEGRRLAIELVANCFQGTTSGDLEGSCQRED